MSDDRKESSMANSDSVLIAGLADIRERAAQIDGKVDKSLALLERVSDRQDRTEARLEKLERDFDAKLLDMSRYVDRKHELARDRVDDSHDAALDAIRKANENTTLAIKEVMREAAADRARIDAKHSGAIAQINMRIALASGAVMVVTFALPMILKMLTGGVI